MEAHEVTPANLHLAVGSLLTNQQNIVRRLDDQDRVLSEIRTQTIKTNGRVTNAESTIVELKAGVEAAMTKACPGKCIPLEAKVRSLEDKFLTAQGRAEGVIFSGRVVWWLIGGGATAVMAALAKLAGVI